MATVTPNFNWPVPTSTDLVKDGATAIEALGDSIDGSLVDLKGGTTGQVLSKTSGTDMDFTWVTTDDANAIQNSIVNAKGDLIGASANDTPAILSVGANGETLVADSSTSTGLRYTAGTVQDNPVLNSAFQIWQRGTSISIAASTPQYVADRWYFFNNASQACTVSRQVTNDTTNLPFIQYAARVQRNSGQTGTGGINLSQSFETINSIPFAGKTVTFSFYARAGANFSAASSVLNALLIYGTGTDQNISSGGYTGGTNAIFASSTLTTTWQRFTYSVAMPSTATEIAPYFLFTPTGTAGANDWFEVTGVQLDIGSVALPFRTNAGTLQGELAACQRYYWRAGGQTAYQAFGTGIFESATGAWLVIQNPVVMRTAPSSIDWSTIGVWDGGAVRAVTGVTAGEFGSYINRAFITVASGGTQFRPVQLYANNSTSAFVGFSAEL